MMARAESSVIAANATGPVSDGHGQRGTSSVLGELLNEQNLSESRGRTASLPALQSPGGRGRRRRLMASLRQKFSRNSVKGPPSSNAAGQPLPASSLSNSIATPYVVDTGDEPHNEEQSCEAQANGGPNVNNAQKQQRQEPISVSISESAPAAAPTVLAADSILDTVDPGREDRPPLAVPRSACAMPLPPSPSPPVRGSSRRDGPVQTNALCTSAAPTTSGSERSRRRNTVSHAAQPNYEDSVYENTAALLNAFGPMRDVGRWYSVYHQQRRSSHSGSLYGHGTRHPDSTSVSVGRSNTIGGRAPLELPPYAHGSAVEQGGETGVYDVVPPSEGHPPEILLANNVCELAKFSWYWGPVSRQEAENLLTGRRDGTFLVRDSSDDRYLLSLTFRSQGTTLHTRIEHHLGRFSFYSINSANYEDGSPSVGQLIAQSMSASQEGAFCFSRQRFENAPSIPVRLTVPYSRRSVVRSLQHICRFVIRQHTRYDKIQELPLPPIVKQYLQEKNFLLGQGGS